MNSLSPSHSFEASPFVTPTPSTPQAQEMMRPFRKRPLNGGVLLQSQKKRRCSQASKPRSTMIYEQYDQTGNPTKKVVLINGHEYEIADPNEGKYHKVFAFADNEQITIGGKTIDSKKVILKIPNPKVGPNKVGQVHDDDLKAYERYLNENVPMPKVFVRPDTFIDTVAPSTGGFWIIEKMDASISLTDQKVLEFVKEWLERSALEKREIVSDFYPRNIMKKDDRICIVDPSPLCEEDEWKGNLLSFLISWSSGSKETYDWFTDNYDAEIKEVLDGMLFEKISKNNGAFPI